MWQFRKLSITYSINIWCEYVLICWACVFFYDLLFFQKCSNCNHHSKCNIYSYRNTVILIFLYQNKALVLLLSHFRHALRKKEKTAKNDNNEESCKQEEFLKRLKMHEFVNHYDCLTSLQVVSLGTHNFNIRISLINTLFQLFTWKSQVIVPNT